VLFGDQRMPIVTTSRAALVSSPPSTCPSRFCVATIFLRTVPHSCRPWAFEERIWANGFMQWTMQVRNRKVGE
jgi:hypothetical protein